MPKKSSYTVEDKIKILKEYQTTDIKKAEVCRKHAISISLFDKWQAQANEGMKSALVAKKAGRKPAKNDKKLKELELQLQRKEHIIAELTSALLGEKKSFLDALKSLVSPGKKN